jgi:hypothetical protein
MCGYAIEPQSPVEFSGSACPDRCDRVLAATKAVGLNRPDNQSVERRAHRDAR